MTTLKEYLDKFINRHLRNNYLDVTAVYAYQQGFIEATKLAAENVRLKNEHGFINGMSYSTSVIDEQSILKAIEDGNVT